MKQDIETLSSLTEKKANTVLDLEMEEVTLKKIRL